MTMERMRVRCSGLQWVSCMQGLL